MPTATPTPTHTPTATPIPPTPTPTPTNTPIPTPTAGEIATARQVVTDLEFFTSDLAEVVAPTAWKWLVDGVTDDELKTLDQLGLLSRNDREAAMIIASSSFLASDITDLLPATMSSLVTINYFDKDVFDRLINQSWFADGLSREEAALVVGLGFVTLPPEGAAEKNLYDYFLRTPLALSRTRTVSLPLAGEVTIYVIGEERFVPNNWGIHVEESMRIIEEFVHEPFPFSYFIILLLQAEIGIGGTSSIGEYIWVRPRPIDPINFSNFMSTVNHETTHQFAIHAEAGTWFTEGMAEFMATYIAERKGWTFENRVMLERRVANCYFGLGLKNILHNKEHGYRTPEHRCMYPMGENFMHNVFEVMGEKAMRAAVRELYVQWRDSFSYFAILREETTFYTDEDIYRTFLNHAPADKKDAFRDVYLRLHGGRYEFDAAAQAAIEAAIAQFAGLAPWLEDPPDESHFIAAQSIFTIRVLDPELAEKLMRMAWVVDGVNNTESRAISYLEDIAAEDVDLATMVTNLPWFGDGVTSNEYATYALNQVHRIASVDPGLARRTVEQSWFTDGIVLSELEKLRQIGE